MSVLVAHSDPHLKALALWARLELSVFATMTVGVALAARPLLETSFSRDVEGALAAAANAFAAFIMGELVAMPFAGWLGERRGHWLVRPLAAAGGLVCAVAGMQASSAAARAIWYGLAGVGAEVAQHWMMGNAIGSPLLRRGAELAAAGVSCAVVLALGVGFYVAVSGPPQGLASLVTCCSGQATLVLVAVLQRLYPPTPSSLLIP